MTYVNPIWLEGQRKKWLRHDWRNWVKPEAHHLYESLEEKRALRFDKVAWQRKAEADAAREREELEQGLLELRWMVRDLQLYLAFRRLHQKYDPDQPRVPAGNPAGGQWTSGIGGQAGRSDEFSGQARRGGPPRLPPTPEQQLRLDIANARAREALSRVQQVDPNWRPAPSVTNSVEGMIRAKQDLTREAEARFIALSRAGQDTSYPWRDAPSTAEVILPRGKMIGYRALGTEENVRTVTPTEFENIRVELMGGAQRIEPDARYGGVWYRRQDGSEFGLRISQHGLTLDIMRSDHPFIPRGFRVHQR